MPRLARESSAYLQPHLLLTPPSRPWCRGGLFPVYGGCVCVGTADNEGFDLEMLGVFNHSGEVNGSSVDGVGAV